MRKVKFIDVKTSANVVDGVDGGEVIVQKLFYVHICFFVFEYCFRAVGSKS